jgi:hypothetical protein
VKGDMRTRSESKMFSLQSFLRKGVSLSYAGRNYNLKDLKDHQIASGMPESGPGFEGPSNRPFPQRHFRSGFGVAVLDISSALNTKG